jgi:hypothetical protein
MRQRDHLIAYLAITGGLIGVLRLPTSQTAEASGASARSTE